MTSHRCQELEVEMTLTGVQAHHNEVSRDRERGVGITGGGIIAIDNARPNRGERSENFWMNGREVGITARWEAKTMEQVGMR